MPDVKRLIAEVASQNGIRLEPDDPAFALVTLNQLVLEEAGKRLHGHVSEALAQFIESLSKTEHLAGRTLAQEVKAAAAEIREDWAANFQMEQSASDTEINNARRSTCRWLALGALCGAVLFGAGFALGRMIGC